MIKLRTILLDALILFAVSTVFVIAADFAFSGLKKKIPKDDPVVTAVGQGEIKGLETAIKEVKEDSNNRDTVVAKTDEHGRTSLMRAAYVNFADPEETAKADDKRPPMVTLLLDEGAPLNAKDHDGWTALMWASWSGLSKVVDTLLERGADIAVADQQGNTALIIAARRGNVEVVKFLLAKGADKAARNKAGHSALQAAELGLKEHPPRFYEARQEPYRLTISALR